jgi:Flp pilus assembly protein TadG
MTHPSAHPLSLPARFFRDTRGAAIIEFAFAFPIFILFFLFITEYGLMMFGNAVIRDVVQQAAHLSEIGCLDAEFDPQNPELCKGTVYSKDQLVSEIKSRSMGFVHADDCALFSFAAVPVSDIDNTGAGCNTTWNSGNGSDIRVFKATYKWPVFFSFLSSLGIFQSTMNFQAVTMVRNEPFGTISNRQ